MNRPLVSIIIPCYNAEAFVETAIRSALDQTYPHKEVIVVDDGSTDGSLTVIRKYDHAIRWETNPNRGGSAARNHGLRMAKGDFIQFLDADDYLAPDKLARQVPALVETAADMVYSDWSEIRIGQHLPLRIVHPPANCEDAVILSLQKQNIQTCSPLHRKQSLLNAGGFREDLPCCQERDLHLRLACQGARFAYVSGALHTVRLHKAGLSADEVWVLSWLQKVLSNGFQSLEARTGLLEKRKVAFASLMAYSGRRLLQHGEREKAMELFQTALQMHPSGGLAGAYSPVGYALARLLGPVRTERVLAPLKRLEDPIGVFFRATKRAPGRRRTEARQELTGLPAPSGSVDVLKTGHLRADLKGRTVRGGVLTLVAQGTKFALQTVSAIILARLLTPEDFGIVAMVTAIIGIGHMFADAGLSQATIQREDIRHEQVSTLFWINVAVGLLLMVAAASLGPALAWFYHEPRLTGIAILVSSAFLFAGLVAQHDALLKRQMRYKALATRDIVAYSTGVSSAVGMAWLGAGYWAIASLSVITQGVQMILSWILVRWRPGFPSRDADVKSMLVFGSNLAASNVVTYLNRNADNVLIGWYWGAGPLGLYSRAYNLLMLPIRQLNIPLNAVAFPAFSRIQDPELYARYYLRTINLIMWISAPLMSFLFVTAEPVIVLLLGEQWRGAASAFQLLAISALAQPLLSTTEWLLVSRGQTGRLLRLGIAVSPIIVGSFVIGLPFGIEGVALSYSLFLIGLIPWMLHFAFKGTQLNLRRLAEAIRYPATLGIVAAVLGLLIDHRTAPEGNLQRLLLAGLAFAITYSLSMTIPRIRKEVLSFGNLWRELRSRNRED